MPDPNPPYKGTLMLAMPNAHCGWSETYWLNQRSFAASQAVLQELAGVRLTLLPATACIDQIRVTNPTLKRASLLRPYNKAGTFTCLEGSYPWWYAILLRIGTTSGHYSNLYLSGLPRLSRGGVIHPPEEWQKAFEKYVAAMKKYCVLARRKGCEKDGRGEGSSESVIYPIDSVTIMNLTTHKRGVGHRRVCGRRRRR